MEERSSVPENHSGNWYVLIAGLPRPSSALTLVPGVSLVPLDDPLSVFDLAAAGAVGLGGWAALEPIAGACRCEVETAMDGATVPGYDALNRAWLASALMVLRGFTRHLCVACSLYSWKLVAGHQKRTSHVFQQQFREEGANAAVCKSKRDLPRFQGQLLDFHLHMLTNKASRTEELSADDAAWMTDHFEVFNKVAAEDRAFRFALEAAIDWRFTKDARTAVARLWSGIEAIFGISSELVYRISLLSACLLAERGNSRQAKFKSIKTLYGLRSKAVHGEELSDEQIATALEDSFILLRDLLIVSINKGHALNQKDFDEAVFG